MKRLSALPHPRQDSDRSAECLCCYDTGSIQESWRLRDEADDCISQMIAPMQCKRCNALANLFISDDPEKPSLSPQEIAQRIRTRYDTRATKEECQELHELALADSKTIGQPCKPEIVEQIRGLDSLMEF